MVVDAARPIGMFDSGVGGLTVAAGLHFWMPFLAFPVALVIIATMVVRVRTPRVTPAVS